MRSVSVMRSLRDRLRNGLGELPAGTLFKIPYGGRSKQVTSEPREHCGLSLNIIMGGTKVDFLHQFDFVDPGDRGW